MSTKMAGQGVDRSYRRGGDGNGGFSGGSIAQATGIREVLVSRDSADVGIEFRSSLGDGMIVDRAEDRVGLWILDYDSAVVLVGIGRGYDSAVGKLRLLTLNFDGRMSMVEYGGSLFSERVLDEENGM